MIVHGIADAHAINMFSIFVINILCKSSMERIEASKRFLIDVLLITR